MKVTVADLASVLIFSFCLIPMHHLSAKPQTFHKDAKQFCPDNLSAGQQYAVFGRMMALGASYTHGCQGCDTFANHRSYFEVRGNSFWIRRHPFVHFLQLTPWKEPERFQSKYLYVMENDGRTGSAALLHPDQLRSDGYAGRWLYHVADDSVLIPNRWDIKRLEEKLGRSSEADLLGGTHFRHTTGPLQNGLHGNFYHVLPSGPNPKTTATMIDLSLDSATMEDIFSFYGNHAIYTELKADGWQNGALRAQLMDSLIARIRAFRPTSIIMMDMLFWDVVAETLYATLDNPNTLTLKILRHFFPIQQFKQQLGNPEVKARIYEDFMRAFQELSRGDHRHSPIPILLGRVIDEPGRYFRENQYAAVVGNLFGHFITQLTGRDFSAELIEWLQNPENKTNSLALVEERRRILEELRRRQIPLPTLHQQHSGHSVSDKRGRHDQPGRDGRDQSVPAWLAGLTNWIILKAMGDLPTFIENLDRFSTRFNTMVRRLHQDPRNNIHMVDFDQFYQNFAEFVQPETMHPSVYGAHRLAGMLNATLCQPQRLEPN